MDELPSGTVTFLFTDIEGSTQLLNQLGGDRYAEILAEHERLLRAAFAAHQGRVVDTQGDSFFVAFRTAAHAVAAAVDAQRDLTAERWTHGGAVRVRMGLHTGEPRMGEQRYVGIGVHRAARIGAAGHGGQVLLSSTTRELAEEDLPPGVSIRDLGERRLKPPPLACSPEGTRGTGRVVEEIDPNTAPTAVAVGADATWVADSEAGTVTRIDPTGLPTPITVGASPSAIALGAGGVWVANRGDDTVVRIDPSTRAVSTTIPVGKAPTGVAVGAGSVWVANSGDGTVSRIDPVAGEVGETIEVGESPQSVIAAEGRIWVTVQRQTIGSALLESSGGNRAPQVGGRHPVHGSRARVPVLLAASRSHLRDAPQLPGQAGSGRYPADTGGCRVVAYALG